MRRRGLRFCQVAESIAFILPMREEGGERRKRMLSPVAPPHFSEKLTGVSMKWKHPRLFFTKRSGRRERKGAGVGERETHVIAISIPRLNVEVN